ncbi:uncharacterized protein GGS22DRAFT_180274 [Annulohypoxylon maeteangense]|uniref:uncharacterized protein n=1 Tax=Annulohypoxylon maeteangense TaxID=1927788 RepID=UPI002008DBE7|nr:uncharacterized protein GGS22DRAFT_180274 [Annulohypoxylon maeteangense]KAI0884273.1 hypothetical protein GGS22DRAFT_180274 [Annulohypoxylon maeteangense]
MEFLSNFDFIHYLSHGKLWDRPDPYYYTWHEKPQQKDGDSVDGRKASRNIAQHLEEGDHKVVIFWGSQSGTSERFAEQLARDCSLRFGLNALCADLSDFDADTIALIPQSKFAIFLLSTYGEGDPSDNTAGLWTWLKKIKDDNVKLPNLRYVAFGLGNSNYKYYNRVVDVAVEAFDQAGATSLLPTGRADDAEGATEEDFQEWKDDVFGMFKKGLGLEEKIVEYQPSVKVSFGQDPVARPGNIINHGSPVSEASSTSSSVRALPVTKTHELFTSGDRNCLHMELHLADHPDVHYKTGDHIGIWPCNPNEEVELLISALGLDDQRDAALSISGKAKIPSPTTVSALFRNHLEICGPLSRKTIFDLAQFAPTAEAKSRALELGGSKEKYADFVSCTHLTLARFLHLSSPDAPWSNLPLSFIVEAIPALQPRYYSIASSSVISPRKIAITVLVSNKTLQGASSQTIFGVTGNYLLSMSKIPLAPTQSSTEARPGYDLAGPEGILQGTKLFAHVRKSKFKLPIASSTPIIMVAAGTGLAPFRAFIAERAKLHVVGKKVGKMVLFFGCRHPDEDFIYREELEEMQAKVGSDIFEIVMAYSRHGKKVYVQDRITENGKMVLDTLDSGANLYICGRASMAREVDRRIEEIAIEHKGMSNVDIKAWTDGLKKRGNWRSDVWG